MKAGVRKWEEREFGRSVDEVDQLRLIFARYFLQKSAITTVELDRLSGHGPHRVKSGRPAAVTLLADGASENALHY